MGLPDLDLDNVRIGFAIVFACWLTTRRLKTTLAVDALITLVEGTCTVLFAQDVLKKYTAGVSIDIQHEYLMTARVALLIMPALTWCFGLCKSTDSSCFTALACSRLVGYGLTAAFMLVEHYRMEIFTPFHILYSVLPCCLWVMVMTVQLVKSGGRVSTSVRNNDMNGVLKYDMAVMLVFSAADIIAPKFFGYFVGRSVEPLHAYLHRINGALAAGAAVLPWIGQRFRDTSDKRAILTARVVSCTAWLVTTAVGYHQGFLPGTDSTRAFMAQATVMMLPALYGWFRSDSGRTWQIPSLRSLDPCGMVTTISRVMKGQKNVARTRSSTSTGSGGRRSRSRSRSTTRATGQLNMVLRPRPAR